MIIPPLPTPFDRRGNPDWGAWRELIDVVSPEVDGILVFGSNGEAVHLTVPERAEGLSNLDVNKPVWVGAGDESLPQATTHVLAARDAGAHAALVTPPRYYAAALGKGGMLSYYRELADLDALPVWLYHVPQLTKVEMPLSLVTELALHENVRGLKDSSGEMARIAFYRSHRADLAVFTGHAPTFLAALALGAEGGILAAANLAPSGYRALFDAWKRGDADEARRWQEILEPLGRVLGQGGFVLLKQALRHLGAPAGYPRPPYPAESPLWPELNTILEPLRERSVLVV